MVERLLKGKLDGIDIDSLINDIKEGYRLGESHANIILIILSKIPEEMFTTSRLINAVLKKADINIPMPKLMHAISNLKKDYEYRYDENEECNRYDAEPFIHGVPIEHCAGEVLDINVVYKRGRTKINGLRISDRGLNRLKRKFGPLYQR